MSFASQQNVFESTAVSSNSPSLTNNHLHQRSLSLSAIHQDMETLGYLSHDTRRSSIVRSDSELSSIESTNNEDTNSGLFETLPSRPPSYNTLVITNQISTPNDVVCSDRRMSDTTFPPSYHEAILISPPVYDIQLPLRNQIFTINNLYRSESAQENDTATELGSSSDKCLVYFLLFVTFVTIIVIACTVITNLHLHKNKN
nr:membrane protein UL56 [Phocid alphaherpesvirus 1]